MGIYTVIQELSLITLSGGGWSNPAKLPLLCLDMTLLKLISLSANRQSKQSSSQFNQKLPARKTAPLQSTFSD